VIIASFSSSFKVINRDIVHGSGLGPTLYIVVKSDLKPLIFINILFMYADDTNLLVLGKTDVEISVEFKNGKYAITVLDQ